MTKEKMIELYLMNSPKVVAEILYDTISRYEEEKQSLLARVEQLEGLCQKHGVDYFEDNT